MPDMTKEQLAAYIKEITLASTRDVCGPLVAEAVKEAMASSMAGMKAANDAWVKQLKDSLEPSDRLPGTWTPRIKREKGQAFGRVVRAFYHGKNDIDKAARFLKQWGDTDLEELIRAEAQRWEPEQSKAMTAGDPETGGILIPEPLSQEIIDILRARVIVRRLNPVTIPMPAGNFRLPKKTSASTATYVGESVPAPTSKVKTGYVSLVFKKLVAVVPTSNDLLRYSSPGADMMIRDDMVDSIAIREDQAFLRDPGTDATPRGLRNWAPPTNVIPATGGVGGDANLAGMTTLLGNLVLILVNNNVPMVRPAWIMSPRTWNNLMITRTTNGPYAFRDEMSRGTLWGWPFVYSTTVPNTLTEGANADTSELYLVDFAEVVIGEAQRLVIDASSEAAYEEGGTTKAAFSRDETVIRAIAEHDLVVRRDVSVAVAKGVRWGV